MQRGELIKKMFEAPKELSVERIKDCIEQSIASTKKDGQMTGAHNLIIAIEELSELQKEVCKYLRGKGDNISITEEVADSILTIFYIINICKVDKDNIYKICNVKLDRLMDMIHQTGEYK